MAVCASSSRIERLLLVAGVHPRRQLARRAHDLAGYLPQSRRIVGRAAHAAIVA
jgi:hypothetical protein